MVCPGRLSGPCSHMHRRNTLPVDDNHTASGHQLHAWVKLSHASQTPLVTVLLLEIGVCFGYKGVSKTPTSTAVIHHTLTLLVLLLTYEGEIILILFNMG